jgi:hypothetical protein
MSSTGIEVTRHGNGVWHILPVLSYQRHVLSRGSLKGMPCVRPFIVGVIDSLPYTHFYTWQAKLTDESRTCVSIVPWYIKRIQPSDIYKYLQMPTNVCVQSDCVEHRVFTEIKRIVHLYFTTYKSQCSACSMEMGYLAISGSCSWRIPAEGRGRMSNR